MEKLSCGRCAGHLTWDDAKGTCLVIDRTRCVRHLVWRRDETGTEVAHANEHTIVKVADDVYQVFDDNVGECVGRHSSADDALRFTWEVR